MEPIIEDLDYKTFKNKVNSLIGLDLDCYKQKQMYRRLNSLLARLNIKNFNEYFNVIKSDKEKLEEFKNFVTINVTEFFRNPEKFDDLITKILPEIMKSSGRTIKIWSAGCSLGAEAYTTSIILREKFPLAKFTILATDIDEEIIKKAKAGIYSQNEIRNVSPEYKKKYFTETEAGFKIDEKVKQNIIFKKNNLLKDPFENDFDLIMCRNVVIYFTEEAKSMLYKKFYNSLKTNGILFVGGTENILNSREIGFTTPHTFFYKKEG